MSARKVPDLVPVSEAAAMLGCSVRTLQRHRSAGKLEFIRRGRCKFCIREEVELLVASDRTEWLAAQLLAPASDHLTANEWFALWADLQDRLARITGVPLDCAPLLREVQPRFGPRRMGTVKARDLAEAIDALDPSLRAEFIGLLAIAGLPPDLGVLDARRRIACAYTGRPPGAAGASGIDRVT
jgi:excisionase family DNA binding protein